MTTTASKIRKPHRLGGDIATPEDSAAFVATADEAHLHRIDENGMQYWSQEGLLDGIPCALHWVTDGPPEWGSAALDRDAERIEWREYPVCYHCFHHNEDETLWAPGTITAVWVDADGEESTDEVEVCEDCYKAGNHLGPGYRKVEG